MSEDDPPVKRDDRPRLPWKGPAPAQMHTRARRSYYVWNGWTPYGRGSDMGAMIAPEHGAKRAQRERRRSERGK